MGFSLDSYIIDKKKKEEQTAAGLSPASTGGAPTPKASGGGFSLDAYIRSKRTQQVPVSSYAAGRLTTGDRAGQVPGPYEGQGRRADTIRPYAQRVGDVAAQTAPYAAGLQAKQAAEMPKSVKTGVTKPAAKAEPPAWMGLMDLPTNELEKRHETAKTQRDALGDRVKREATPTPASSYSAAAGQRKAKEANPIPSSAAASGGWVSEEDKLLAPLRREVNRKQDEVNDLATAHYHRRNQEQLARLETDARAKAGYLSAKELTEDLDALSKALSAPSSYNGMDSRFRSEGEALKKKYGTDDLQALQRTLTAQKAQRVKELGEKGYDFEDMAGYDLMLRQQDAYLKNQERVQKEAEEHPGWMSAGSVLAAPFQGVDFVRTNLKGVGHSNADDLESYVPANVYDMYATNLVQTIRGTVSRKIEENTDWEIFGRNVASFLYNTGMSMADSALQVATMGSGATYLMGLSAAANSTKEIIERGGSNSQAFWGGLAAGAAEAVFEKFSIDKLLSAKSVTGWKSFLLETLKQGGVEASEEMLTEIANILSEAVIMGERSDLTASITEYRGKGMSQDTATLKAFLDCVGEVAWAGAGGLVSGVGMGGAVNAVNGYLGKAAGERVANSMAEDILASPEAMKALGVTLTDDMTQTQKKAAVKDALEGLMMEQKNASDGEAGSTYIDTNPATHTPEQMERIKEYQGATDNAILAFIKKWTGLKNPDYRKKIRITIAEVTAQAVEDVKAAVGVDTSGYEHALSGGALEHIELRHGRQGNADHSMADPNDIARMGYVLENYDSVTPVLNPDGTQKLSKEYQNADHTPAPLIQFSKRIDGTYYVVEAVPDSAAHQLRVVSAYLRKDNGSTDQMLNMPPSGPQPTSKTPNGANTSTDPIIHSPGDGIKDYFAQDGTENSGADPATQPPSKAAAKGFATETGTEPGLVQDDYVQKRLRPETAERINAIAQALGLRVRFVNSVRGGTANASIRDNEIRIERYNPNPVVYLLGHELTHRMQQMAPEAYARFREAIGTEAEREAEGLYTLYQSKGVKLSYDGAVDEAVANYAGRLMENGQVLDEFIERHREDKTLLEKLRDAIRELISKLTGAEKQRAETAEGKLLAALEETAKQAANPTGRTAATEGGEESYQIKELPDGKKYVKADRQVIFGNDPISWGEQVENYINGKIRRGEDVRLLTEDGQTLILTKKTAGKISSPYTSKGTTLPDEKYYTKVNAGAHIDELAQISKVVAGKTDEDGRHGDFAANGWQYRTAYFQDFDGKYYRLRISVAQGVDGHVIYNIGDIQERRFPTVDGSSAKSGALSGGKASS